MTESLKSFVQRCSDNDELFSSLCTFDEALRKAATNKIIETVRGWLVGLSKEESTNKMRFSIGGIVTLANECPFEDVRQSFSDFLEELKSQMSLPQYYDSSADVTSPYAPSHFVPPSKLAPLKDEDVLKNIQENFVSKGRVSNLLRSMCYFPSYLEKFLKIQNFIIKEETLPLHWINYIAILGASRYQCEYLVVNQQVEFYKNGGDLSWLESISNAPKKIRNLSKLNAILAHQPWQINKKDISELVTGEDSWNIPELVLAITILVTFHSLCGFVQGFGVTLEVDRRGDEYSNQLVSFPGSPEEGEGIPEKQDSTTELFLKLKHPGQYESDSSLDSQTLLDSSKLFEESGMKWAPQEEKISSKIQNLPDYRVYWDSVEMSHVDFDVKSTNYKIFRLLDYNWEEQGYSLIENYYPGLGELLDSIFTETKNLTEYTLFDSKDVDTGPFRQAIWYYVLRLKGMLHDDYEYVQVNHFLNIELKKYIKKVACYPQLVTSSDYAHMGIHLFHSEKAHINFIIMESKRQAELLYALQAIMYYKGE